MQVIPGIYLRKGRCVRLMQGDLRDEDVFSTEPVSIAKLWEYKGAKSIHVVDIDGALTGEPKNWEIAFKIAKAVRIPIQLGGGIRELSHIKEAFKGGVTKAILGTSAVENPELLKEAILKWKDKISVSLDAKGDTLAVRGWKQLTTQKVIPTTEKMVEYGVRNIIFTDINRDGTLSGPNFKSLKDIAKTVKVFLWASGGVGTYMHLKNLMALERYAVKGVIVGRALYIGAIDLREAINFLDGRGDTRFVGKKKKK